MRLTSVTAMWLRCLTKLVRRLDVGAGTAYTAGGIHEQAYSWFEMEVFVHWKAPDNCRIICIDTPKDFQDALLTALQESPPLQMADACAMARHVVQQVVSVFEMTVWRLRDCVRSLEQVGTTIS